MKQMKDVFMSYDQAKILKTLGFKFPVKRFYNKNGKLKWAFANGLGQYYDNSKKAVSAPVYTEFSRWCKDEHDIIIHFMTRVYKDLKGYSIVYFKDGVWKEEYTWEEKTHEELIDPIFEFVVKIIKERK